MFDVEFGEGRPTPKAHDGVHRLVHCHVFEREISNVDAVIDALAFRV